MENDMLGLVERRILCWVSAIIIAWVIATPALAGFLDHERWRGERSSSARHKDGSRPKDCTRYNGRWGYYGNPWCTPAEQRAFDIWDARRIERERLGR